MARDSQQTPLPTPVIRRGIGICQASLWSRRGVRKLDYLGIRPLHPKLDLATQPLFA